MSFSGSKVRLFGACLGLSCFFVWDGFIVRPNRIAAGEAIALFKALPPFGLALMLALWLWLGIAAWLDRESTVWPEYLAALGCLPLLLWTVGLSSSRLLAAQGEFARISLGGGTWLMLFALFILLSDVLRRMDRYPLPKYGLLCLALLVSGLIVAGGWLNDLSLLAELLQRQGRFLQETGNHLWITFFSVSLSAVIGVPLGLAVYQLPSLRSKAFFLLNMVQTIPSLALFGLLIAPLALLVQAFPVLESAGVRGIGWTPAVIALTLYGLLPIVRNTYAGFSGVDAAVCEAGLGIGMSRRQLLFFVEIPLALPVILNGLRTACVQNIGNTAVAALIGAGGLGVFIFQGLGQAALDLILLGAVPTILIAVAVDFFWQGGIRWLNPR